MVRSSLAAIVLLSLVAFAAGCGKTQRVASGGQVGQGATQRPGPIVRQAEAALRRVRSYRMVGAATDENGSWTAVIDVASTGAVRATLRQDGKLEFIYTRDGFFIKPSRTWVRNKAIFDEQLLSGALGDRWWKVPLRQLRGVGPLARQSRPGNLARCLRKRGETLHHVGVVDLGKRRAIMITDDGDVPGGTPKDMYFSVSRPHRLLRVVQTAPRTRGGKLDRRCDAPGDTTTHADWRLTRVNSVAPISAPAGAVDVAAMRRIAGGARSSR